jgi:hypothetical protein
VGPKYVEPARNGAPVSKVESDCTRRRRAPPLRDRVNKGPQLIAWPSRHMAACIHHRHPSSSRRLLVYRGITSCEPRRPSLSPTLSLFLSLALSSGVCGAILGFGSPFHLIFSSCLFFISQELRDINFDAPQLDHHARDALIGCRTQHACVFSPSRTPVDAAACHLRSCCRVS